MANNSNIEWCEATWNPLAGCSIVSTECKNCYAMKMAKRLAAMGQKKYEGTTHDVNGHTVWTGKINVDYGVIDAPLDRKKPTTYFVNSMSDWCHEDVPQAAWTAIMGTMLTAHWHTFQCLTKRPERQRDLVNAYINQLHPGDKKPIRNIWLGTSVGIKASVSRIKALQETNAHIRFISFEPLLEDVGQLDLSGIQWAILGGESGAGARPCDVQWIRNIVSQCRHAGVKVFVKQLGRYPGFSTRNMSGSEAGQSYHHYDDKSKLFIKAMGDGKGGILSEFPPDLKLREYPAP